LISSVRVAPFSGRILVSHEGKCIGRAWAGESSKKVARRRRLEHLGFDENIAGKLIYAESASEDCKHEAAKR